MLQVGFYSFLLIPMKYGGALSMVYGPFKPVHSWLGIRVCTYFSWALFTSRQLIKAKYNNGGQAILAIQFGLLHWEKTGQWQVPVNDVHVGHRDT